MSLFDDMTVFVRAVEAESFSGAAQRLRVAKSVVSRRMASLEGRLGTSLFHRTTRRLSLTETGHAYYERARRILADVAEAEDVAPSRQTEGRGHHRSPIGARLMFGWEFRCLPLQACKVRPASSSTPNGSVKCLGGRARDAPSLRGNRFCSQQSCLLKRDSESANWTA